MSKGTEYLLKFADFLDEKNAKKEADYIDKLILFINKNAEKNILLTKKSNFINNLVKLADKCDICNSRHCADGLDEDYIQVGHMPESYMAKPQLAKINQLSEELFGRIYKMVESL